MAVIGITSCSKLEDYRQAVLHAGGEVMILALPADVERALSAVDALLLTGGSDVAPERYGDVPRAHVTDIDPARDDFELALVGLARARQLPLLAICRGIQVMNVAYGGTLIQDIPSEMSGALPHKLDIPPHQPFSLAHEIWIEKDSLLSRVMRDRLNDADVCEVNSRHHQAVKRVAAGLTVSATAPDGIIEAIEDPAARFGLGVQWHPENFWRTGEFRPLFEAFVAAAERRSG
jgi:putative glutamine amidotransferase